MTKSDLSAATRWLRRVADKVAGRGKLPSAGGGGGSPAMPGPGPLAVGDPAPLSISIKDFPSKARFTARMAAISEVDDQWFTYNREQRREMARLSRHHGKGYTR